MDRHTRDYVRVEKLETLEDAIDNRRQLFAVEIVLHLLALLGRTVLGVETVQPNLIRDHRKIAEIRKGLAQLIQNTTEGLLVREKNREE